jgi:hypothetical protein
MRHGAEHGLQEQGPLGAILVHFQAIGAPEERRRTGDRGTFKDAPLLAPQFRLPMLPNESTDLDEKPEKDG